MARLSTKGIALLVALVCCTRMAAAEPVPRTESDPPRTVSSGPFLLGPPTKAGPVVVRARFEFHDILEINDGEEMFEFSGVLTLTWNDPRQTFEPAVAGVDEKVFQGAYQFKSSRQAGIRRWSSPTNPACTRRAESCCVYSRTAPRP